MAMDQSFVPPQSRIRMHNCTRKGKREARMMTTATPLAVIPPQTKSGKDYSTVLKMPEETLLAELTILDYLLHESISLRLGNLFPADSSLKEADMCLSLGRAQYYSELVQRKSPCPKN